MSSICMIQKVRGGAAVRVASRNQPYVHVGEGPPLPSEELDFQTSTTGALSAWQQPQESVRRNLEDQICLPPNNNWPPLSLCGTTTTTIMGLRCASEPKLILPRGPYLSIQAFSQSGRCIPLDLELCLCAPSMGYT